MTFNPLHFTDNNGNQIQLGDVVNATRKRGSGKEVIPHVFVFCIPQHRFGFIRKEEYDWMVEVEAQNGFDRTVLVEPFVLDWTNLDFYYTPISKKTIVVLGASKTNSNA